MMAFCGLADCGIENYLFLDHRNLCACIFVLPPVMSFIASLNSLITHISFFIALASHVFAMQYVGKLSNNKGIFICFGQKCAHYIWLEEKVPMFLPTNKLG